MVKNASEIAALLGAQRSEMRNEFMRIALLNRKIKGQLTRTWMPKNADSEYRDLFKKASGPWLEFTRDSIAQGVRIDGCNNDKVWEAWQSNGMDGRQGGINREIVGLGKSFALVVPAATMARVPVTDPLTGEAVLDDDDEPLTEAREVADYTQAVIRPLSSLVTYAYFDDPWDDYPTWVLTRVGPQKANFWESKWVFIDDEAVYRFSGDATSGITGLLTFEHGLGYTPVAQINNTIPTTGEPESSVERAIPVYQRIVDATFTLEMKQRYGAFPQKWMTGGTIGTDASGKPAANVSADSLIHNSDPEGKFGNFAEGSLADVVVAVDAHIKHLAAVCQVPPHYLLGAVVNMSAEGIAAAESGYFRNIGERQDAMSEGYELAMRIVGDILGESPDDIDKISMHFEDVSSRSLSQVADAIGKIALLAPGNLDRLLAMVPGFTQIDAQLAAQATERVQQAAVTAAPVQQAISAPVTRTTTSDVVG